MKMLRSAAIGATGFRSVCFALFAMAGASLAAPAEAGTVYTLSGSAMGTRTQLNPNTHQVVTPPGTTPFNASFEFDFASTGSLINLGGLALVRPANTATFLPLGGFPASLQLSSPLPNQLLNPAFAIGTGINTGFAALGNYDSATQNFDSFILFGGLGLVGYDGVSSLAATPVSIEEFPAVFFTSRLGNLVGWDFDDTKFTNVKFSAVSVPEPATLTLFGAGFAGVAAMRRRKKRV